MQKPPAIASILLARASWVLAVYTLLFLVALAAMVVTPPFPKPDATLALMVLGLGVITWLVMFVACVWVFLTVAAAARPSIASSLAFFSFFAGELYFVASTLHLL